MKNKTKQNFKEIIYNQEMNYMKIKLVHDGKQRHKILYKIKYKIHIKLDYR